MLENQRKTLAKPFALNSRQNKMLRVVLLLFLISTQSEKSVGSTSKIAFLPSDFTAGSRFAFKRCISYLYNVSVPCKQKRRTMARKTPASRDSGYFANRPTNAKIHVLRGKYDVGLHALTIKIFVCHCILRMFEDHKKTARD